MTGRDIDLGQTARHCTKNDERRFGLRGTKMARQRKEKNTGIRLKHPDRSGPDPSQETLLDIAAKRGLLNIPEGEEAGNPNGLDENGEPLVGRVGESVLWSISLTMLHFTLDVLVAHQYAVEIRWPDILSRTAQAFPSTLTPPTCPGNC